MVVIYESPKEENVEQLSKKNIASNEVKETSDIQEVTSEDTLNQLNIRNSEEKLSDNEFEEMINEKSNFKIVENSKLSAQIQKFLNIYLYRVKTKKESLEGNIKVSNLLGGIARAYEKIRTSVEYKGEHVLRRNAIERILKRLAWEKESLRPNINIDKIAENLIKEIIWAGYLKNESVPNEKIKEISKIISKYFYLLENLDNIPRGISVSKIRTWLWGVASSEIEDVLDPSNRDLYVELMMNWFKEYFDWSDTSLPENEKDLQIYIAIHRSYPKSDDPIIRYHLLLKVFPDWYNAEKTEINKLIINFPRVYKDIENQLSFSGRYVIYRKIQKYSAAFEIFKNLVEEEKSNIEKILLNEKKLEARIIDICESKYKEVKKKINTGIVRSIIYIFITKVALALVLEVPYEVYRFGDVRFMPLTINIFIPPLLMFIIGLTIKTPGGKNTQLILEKIESFVYKIKSHDKYQFSIIRKNTGSTIINIFSVFYVILFLLVFGGISYLLKLADFSIFGGGIFFIFLSLVLLFAFRIRYQASQLKIEEDKEGFISHLSSYLTLPLLNFGFFLARGFAKLNFLTIILDFLIEAPLKSIIEIFEEWTSFVREKKEEVVEIPE